jgi:maleylpyruvate isomerase
VTELPSWDTLVGWAADGQQHVERAAAGLDPALLGGPSRLPDWSRGYVLTHLARNADALANLLAWARTGVQTPMYASPAERDDGILAGAGRDLPEQLADLAAAGARFLLAAGAVPEARRSATVVNGQGGQIPAGEIPWLRVREVWLHLIDLDAGPGADDLPDAVAWTLTRDVAGSMTPRASVTVDLAVRGHGTLRVGTGPRPASTIDGTAARIAAWLTGRGGTDGLTATGGFPDLPPWL